MNSTEITSLEPAALSVFAATLANLPREEIQKAKKLYILNAIAEFKAQRAAAKAMVITMGIMCIIPIFLIVFIPALIGYQNGMAAARQKILNAIDVWKEDIGPDYLDVRRQAEE